MDFSQNDAMEPATDELHQESAPLGAVIVDHPAPMLVKPLPARTAYSRNISVADTGDPAQLEQIATQDLRRQYLTVIVTGFPAYIGHDKQDVASGLSGILPIGVPLTLPTSEAIYVRGLGGISVVSYWSGNWAD